MALPQLPLKVVQWILSLFPLKRLGFLYDNWPPSDPLKLVLEGFLFDRISCGDRTEYELFHPVSYDTLSLLAKGQIRVSVRRLKIFDSHGRDPLELLALNQEHPEFFRSIPRFEYEGRAEKLEQYLKIVPLGKIERCHLDVFGGADFVPPNLKDITIHNYRQPTLTIESWPTTLTSMKVVCSFDLSQEHCELPERLKTLVCFKTPKLWNRFPRGLESLHVLTSPQFSLEDSVLPDLLQTLWIELCDIRDVGVLPSRLPHNLKVLNLRDNAIQSLSNIVFPSALEVLDVAHCKITTIEDVVFPSLLRKLCLENNKITSLENCKFPDLKSLDISINKITTLSNVDLPSTLENLLAIWLRIEWSKTKLPQGLKYLSISTIEDPGTLEFPPSLEILRLEVRCSSNLFKLALPKSLYKMNLWDQDGTHVYLDLLSSDPMRNSVPFRVPKIIKIIVEGRRKRSYYRKLEIPYRVQKMKVTFLMKKDSDVMFEMLNFEPQKKIHLHGLHSIALCVKGDLVHLDCTETNFPRAMRLSITGLQDFEESEMVVKF